MTDADGNIAQHVEYIPYGEVFVDLIRDKDQDNFMFKIQNINIINIYKVGKFLVKIQKQVNMMYQHPEK
ncbi:MAG: hypothetical protein UH850_08340 [Paludibacteraceae bacterium]|nr:hypothetical protein [Paludibacteraceae bacterium]